MILGWVRDGRRMVAALPLGADAVATRPRFAASTDSPDGHPSNA